MAVSDYNTNPDLNVTIGGINIAEGCIPSNVNNAIRKLMSDVRDALPSGIIMMWSGSAASIPAEWLLCNGNNGTPDLRDRFIVGAGYSYGPGETGGAVNKAVSVSADGAGAGVYVNAAATAISVGGTTLTYSTIPSHAHGVLEYSGVTGNMTTSRIKSETNGSAGNMTAFVGESQSHAHAVSDPGHTHTIQGTWHTHTLNANAIDVRPPYYALCFIMKK